MSWISNAEVLKPPPCEIIHNVGLTQPFHGEFRCNARGDVRRARWSNGGVTSVVAGQGGGVITVGTRDQAIAFGTLYAAEHALIATRDASAVAAELRNAGTVFVGEASSVSFGDYMTGANHVLPTGGMARSYSGLSTLDFYRWTTWQVIDRAAAGRLADDVGRFADAEGLPGHAAAARQWINES